ncbi:MAG: ATP-binding protein [Chloroflexi bacterium]|nr:ATP-binding protein [Chloroflexota bacterium]
MNHINGATTIPSIIDPATLRLGSVVGGSLTKGLEVRLAPDRSVEEMAAGRYVTIEAAGQKFFGMITDVELRTASDAVLRSPPDPEDDFLREVFAGTAAFAILQVMPLLRVTGTADSTPEPVKTVPSHFSEVRDATQAEVAQIFGEDDSGHFVIGSPLDMDVKVCLSYERFVERSNGVFGKSGTGKTFLTRSVLTHVIQKSGAQRDAKKRAVNLIFDMHNEYGWKGTFEGGGGEVKALKQLLGNVIVVMTLDENSSRRRKVPYDAAVTIRYEDIEPDDIAVLQETLNLTQNAVEATYALHRHFGAKTWLRETMDMHENEEDTSALLSRMGIHPASILNLRRGLQRLTRNKSFMVETGGADSVQTILKYLLGGRHVVIEFGEYGNDLPAYMLVANVLTRRIHDVYRERKEASMGGGGEEPPHLIITIEEAHKFLAPQVARQTIFGEIAREMRKYNVTLLVIDQRPSAIDEEVRSQIATKITCLLDNEKDIDAVLGGVSGAKELRAVLAKLETKQQALILGHAVPMPVVVKTETYGTADSYAKFKERLGVAGVSDLYGE